MTQQEFNSQIEKTWEEAETKKKAVLAAMKLYSEHPGLAMIWLESQNK